MNITRCTLQAIPGRISINAAIENNNRSLLRSEIEKYDKLDDFK